MYIHRIKTTNKKTGKEYFSVFLCSKYREKGKIKTRTEANLSHLPEYVVMIAELNNSCYASFFQSLDSDIWVQSY